MGKQSLKKLSDDAILKRMDALQEAVKEMGDEFDKERAQQYLESDKALASLEAMDLDEKLEPLEKETSEGIERLLGEMLATADEENRMLDSQKKDEAEEAE